MTRAVFTLTCDDRPGIVAAIASAVASSGGNIAESAQFGDSQTQRFFMRTVIDTSDVDVLRAALAQECDALDAHWGLTRADARPRVMLMVSKLDHCLLDLLYRWRVGELAMDVVMVVSNHEDTRAAVEAMGVPFTRLEVTPETKALAERELLDLVADLDVDLVVLARYMQILSDDVCKALTGRAINIHHSFLPGFKGARPYHQAHDRGVKLIGATAHFVTADLDEGPIIEQDVVRVTHAQEAYELVARGRDVECRVLASAVHAFIERRVFLNGHRTVVFS